MIKLAFRYVHPAFGRVRRYLLIALLSLPGLASADITDITLFHCIDPDVGDPGLPDGSVTVWIGYNSNDSQTQTFTGPDNYFSPPPQARNQITDFLPGFHERAFSFYLEPSDFTPVYCLGGNGNCASGARLEITRGLEDYCSPAINDLVVTPSGVLFAGTADAGVFRSTDDGASWQPVNTGLGDHHVHTLERHPSNPAILFAGTDEGVYKSVDGGDTWQAINSGLPGVDGP